MPPVEIPANRLDYISPRVWTAYVRDIPLPADHITELYLPMQDIEADRIYEEIGKYAKPMAPFWDQDAESPQIDRGASLTNVWFDAFWVKFKERFRGSDLRWLRMYGDRPVSDPAGLMASVQKRRVTEAMDDLNSSVDTRIEWMRMQALLGRITQAPNVDSEVDIDISYPVTTVTADPLWSDTETADPILDIQLWTRAMRNQGVTYADLIIGLDDLWNLQQNRRLRAAVSTATFTKAFLSPAEVDAQFSQFGISLKPYNSVYTLRTRDGTTGVPTDTAYPILPSGKAVLMPREKVGYCGTVPQELNNWACGKYTWRNDPTNNPGMQDPIRHELGVGWAGMPIIRFANRVLVLTIG